MFTLTQPIDPNNRPNIAGWLISEKLDGPACFWDGGTTRGLPTYEIPWAQPSNQISTGLWSEQLRPIRAPRWFLDQLPPVLMAGVMSDRQFIVCDTPPLESLPAADWLLARIKAEGLTIGWSESTYAESMTELHDALNGHPGCHVHLQRYLPTDEAQAWEVAGRYKSGAVIRDPLARYGCQPLKV